MMIVHIISTCLRMIYHQSPMVLLVTCRLAAVNLDSSMKLVRYLPILPIGVRMLDYLILHEMSGHFMKPDPNNLEKYKYKYNLSYIISRPYVMMLCVY